MMRFLPFLFTILFWAALPSAFAAEPVGPFGLGVGKDTWEELKTQFMESGCSHEGESSFMKGPVVICPSESVNFENLRQATFVFNSEEILSAVFLELNEQPSLERTQFKSLLKSLSQKYKLIQKNVPIVGDAFAKFKAGGVSIVLNDPHMDRYLYIDYSTPEFDKKLKAFQAEQKKLKEDAQGAQL